MSDVVFQRSATSAVHPTHAATLEGAERLLPARQVALVSLLMVAATALTLLLA